MESGLLGVNSLFLGRIEIMFKTCCLYLRRFYKFYLITSIFKARMHWLGDGSVLSVLYHLRRRDILLLILCHKDTTFLISRFMTFLGLGLVCSTQCLIAKLCFDCDFTKEICYITWSNLAFKKDSV